MNNFLVWLIGSFERKGKVSARKLTVFVAFILFNIGFIVHLTSGVTIQKEYVIIYATIVLLGLGFLTAENIVELFKSRFGLGGFSSTFSSTYLDTNRVDNPDEEVM
jgi:hypothetical protein